MALRVSRNFDLPALGVTSRSKIVVRLDNTIRAGDQKARTDAGFEIGALRASVGVL